MTKAKQAQRTDPSPIIYGCFCDLEPDIEPDDCVIDRDALHDCKMAKPGMSKEQCEYWRPVFWKQNPALMSGFVTVKIAVAVSEDGKHAGACVVDEDDQEDAIEEAKGTAEWNYMGDAPDDAKSPMLAVAIVTAQVPLPRVARVTGCAQLIEGG
jgi:hypothetical protein